MKTILNMLSSTANLLVLPVKYGIKLYATPADPSTSLPRLKFQASPFKSLKTTQKSTVPLKKAESVEKSGPEKKKQFWKRRFYNSKYWQKGTSDRNSQIPWRRKEEDFPGIYVVKYSDESIKIGRSQHVQKRLKSYKGYQSLGQDIERLLLIETEDHRNIERKIHKFASESGLERIGNLEIFKCTDQTAFCSSLTEFVKTLGPVKTVQKHRFNEATNNKEAYSVIQLQLDTNANQWILIEDSQNTDPCREINVTIK